MKKIAWQLTSVKWVSESADSTNLPRTITVCKFNRIRKTITKRRYFDCYELRWYIFWILENFDSVIWKMNLDSIGVVCWIYANGNVQSRCLWTYNSAEAQISFNSVHTLYMNVEGQIPSKQQRNAAFLSHTILWNSRYRPSIILHVTSNVVARVATAENKGALRTLTANKRGKGK